MQCQVPGLETLLPEKETKFDVQRCSKKSVRESLEEDGESAENPKSFVSSDGLEIERSWIVDDI